MCVYESAVAYGSKPAPWPSIKHFPWHFCLTTDFPFCFHSHKSRLVCGSDRHFWQLSFGRWWAKTNSQAGLCCLPSLSIYCLGGGDDGRTTMTRESALVWRLFYPLYHTRTSQHMIIKKIETTASKYLFQMPNLGVEVQNMRSRLKLFLTFAEDRRKKSTGADGNF